MLKLVLSLLLVIPAYANMVNPVDYEQNPSHINWKKIDTKNFEIIFPDTVEQDAQKVAHLLEKAFPYVTRSLQVRPERISIILQNQSIDSNGMVTLAPRRSEWYLTPGIDPIFNNTEWLKTLSIHEFRHVVQFQKSRRGFNKFLNIILGEIGQALGLGLTLPPWYLEGDAVGMETALTNGGRGRLPLFERNLRALLLADEKYSYDKAHMGSFDDFVPNHYVYGYFYTSYMRNMYGDYFLSHVADEAARHSFNPFTFYNSTKRLTGKSFERFYAHVMRDLVREWKKKLDAFNPTPYKTVNLQEKFGWTNYEYPQVTSDKKIVALKSGLSYINHFVLIDGKEEKVLFYPGPLKEYPYKLRQNRLAYVELELDPRWGYRDFTQVKVYDLKHDRVVFEMKHSKVRLAVLDHSGINLLVVDWNDRQEQHLSVINIKTKKVTSYRYPNDKVISSVDWVGPERIVLVVKDSDDKKSVVDFDLKTQLSSELLAPSFSGIGFVHASQGHVFLESPQSGIDNIFLLEDGNLTQLTSSRFGAYAPTLDGGELVYNDYDATGMNIVRKSLPWKKEENSSDSFVPVYEKFASSENKTDYEFDLGQKEKYAVQDYSQFKNAINLHSWTLLAPPLSSTVQVQGFSRDLLNKFSLTAGGGYDLNERESFAIAGMRWSHFYPVFDLSAQYGNRRQKLRRAGKNYINRWEEAVAEAGVQIPWNKIIGRFTQDFGLRAFSRLIAVTNRLGGDRDEINDGALFSPGAQVSYSLLSRMSTRDLLPPLGVLIDYEAQEGRSTTGDKNKGAIQTLDTRLYLPGLWHHHSFYHQFAYEKQRSDPYRYASGVFYPRGTTNWALDEFTKYSGNYTFPLFYPDWKLDKYFYFKRLSMNLFYDSINGREKSLEYHTSSAGWELLFDTHFLRIFIPLSWGVRGSYVIGGSDHYELFLTSTLGNF